jgi:hypothetical protein
MPTRENAAEARTGLEKEAACRSIEPDVTGDELRPAGMRRGTKLTGSPRRGDRRTEASEISQAAAALVRPPAAGSGPQPPGDSQAACRWPQIRRRRRWNAGPGFSSLGAGSTRVASRSTSAL